MRVRFKMASRARVSENSCAESDPLDRRERPSGARASPWLEYEYDFVEEVSQDYLCPVTFELLRDPQQTTCCGHHLSVEAVTRLRRGRKPCPMCNKPNLTTIPDKFYKRKVNELKVHCPNKGSGCEWVGGLGSQGQHSSCCGKRPWQCRHCDFKGTHDEADDHKVSKCMKPCPNHCEIGTIPPSDVEKHLTECPLQLVECELVQAGCCQEKVLRQDLSQHMREEFHRHLLSMSLLNLHLTRDLHQKIDRKDENIATKDRKITEKDQQIVKLQRKNRELEQQVQQLKDQLHQQNRRSTEQQQLVVDLQRKLEPLSKFKEEIITHMGIVLPLSYRQMVINDYSARKRRPNVTLSGQPHYHECCSEKFYSHGYYLFQFTIQIFQNGSVEGYLCLEAGHYDHNLHWPIQCTAALLLVNQLGDNGHRLEVVGTQLDMTDRNEPFPIAEPLIEAGELGFNAERHTQYLKNDTLHFKLHLSVAKK